MTAQRAERRQIALTGIQPSGTPHLGNYLGAIRPALGLVRDHRAFYFIADHHALTTIRDPEELRKRTYEVAATWVALGLDPSEVVLYRQSDVPEVHELAWILACVTPKGLMNRAHAYKDAVDENLQAGRTADDGISMGLFNYPVLMASDILICRADVVPVGRDNTQHVEMADDMARAFNRTYGEVLTIPRHEVREDVATITGLDGRKMSKSYGNVIPIFSSPEEYRKLARRVVTDSRRPEEPKDPDSCNVFAIYRHFARAAEVEATRRRYLEGGIGYVEVKDRLGELLEETFGPHRARFEELRKDSASLDRIFADGAERVRTIVHPLMKDVRSAVGLPERQAR